MRPIKQRPWFIGLLSSFVVDRTLRDCGIAQDAMATFDRVAYDATSPVVPPFAGKSVVREDLQLPAADSRSTNGARLYSPVEMDASSKSPIIIYCHGGGWVLGSPYKQPYESLCADLCNKLNCHVLSVDYRKAPEHAWPAAAEDVYSVLEWLADESSNSCIPINVDRHQVVLMGESAGGNLAACVSLMWRDRQPRGVSVAHQVLLSPCVPTRPLLPSRKDPSRANGALLPEWLMEYFEDEYAGGDVEALVHEPYFNPLAAESMAGLPPITGVVGGAEVLRDEGLSYFTAASEAGVDVEWREFEDGYHAFVIFPFGQSADAWSFVRERLRASKLLDLRGGALQHPAVNMRTTVAFCRTAASPPQLSTVARGATRFRMCTDETPSSTTGALAPSEVLSESAITQLFAWVSCALAGDERYDDLGIAFALIFSELWGSDVEAELGPDAPRARALLQRAMANLPPDEKPVGAPVELPQRIKASLGAMGAAQWTGQFRTRPHALLDVRRFGSVDEWARTLPRSARRNLAKATADDAGFTVSVQPIRGGEPAPHSTLAHFRAVVEHEVRVLAESPDDVLGALSTAISRYVGTTRMAGVIREYRDVGDGRVIAFAHEVAKGRVIRGQWFYANDVAARRRVWFHAVHDLVSRAIADEKVDIVDLGPSGSDAFSELKARYGFKSVGDWCSVADYSGPFRSNEDERPQERLVGWLAGLMY